MKDRYTLAKHIEQGAGKRLGSARVSRVGFGVSPKQSFCLIDRVDQLMREGESSRSRGHDRQHARRVRYP
jgi:hypothetical protein